MTIPLKMQYKIKLQSEGINNLYHLCKVQVLNQLFNSCNFYVRLTGTLLLYCWIKQLFKKIRVHVEKKGFRHFYDFNLFFWFISRTTACQVSLREKLSESPNLYHGGKVNPFYCSRMVENICKNYNVYDAPWIFGII